MIRYSVLLLVLLAGCSGTIDAELAAMARKCTDAGMVPIIHQLRGEVMCLVVREKQP